MDYTPTHPKAPHTQLRLASIAVTFLAFLTGLIYLQVALTSDLEEGVGAETAVLLIIGLLGLLFAWKWLAVGGLIGIIAGICIAALAYNSLSSNQLFAAILYGSPFIVAGGLRVACWQQTER